MNNKYCFITVVSFLLLFVADLYEFNEIMTLAYYAPPLSWNPLQVFDLIV